MVNTATDDLQRARESGVPNPAVWAELAKPFPPSEIEKLPKQLRRNDEDRGQCRQGTKYSADGHYCGGYHARSLHLDYVGHAGITMRLNDVVTPAWWDWEPVASGPDGLPLVSREFWIRLTIMGVSRLGVGDDFGGSAKQAIGDALRNAAMRFGIATYLWSKSDAALALKQAEEGVDPVEEPKVTRTRGKDPDPRWDRGGDTQTAKTAEPPQDRAHGDPAPTNQLNDGPATNDQRTHLVNLYGLNGIGEKEEVLADLSKRLGRTVASTVALTRSEAHHIIDDLEAQV